jgi:hypothetical protein
VEERKENEKENKKLKIDSTCYYKLSYIKVHCNKVFISKHMLESQKDSY